MTAAQLMAKPSPGNRLTLGHLLYLITPGIQLRTLAP